MSVRYSGRINPDPTVNVAAGSSRAAAAVEAVVTTSSSTTLFLKPDGTRFTHQQFLESTPWERASLMFMDNSPVYLSKIEYEPEESIDVAAAATYVVSEPALVGCSQSHESLDSSAAHQQPSPCCEVAAVVVHSKPAEPPPLRRSTSKKKKKKTVSFKNGSSKIMSNPAEKTKHKSRGGGIRNKVEARRRSEPCITTTTLDGSPRKIGPNSRYQILTKKLAYGGSAEIMRAYDCERKRDVVIKYQAHKSLRGRQAQREYSFYKLLRSVWKEERRRYSRGYKCVVQVFSQFTMNSGLKHCIVMEMANMGSLLELLQARGGIQDYELARSMFNDMAEALNFLHLCDIAHRDVKLDNFLVFKSHNSRKLTVKLCDLGFATYFTKNSHDDESCGSPHYAAPEVLTGRLYSPPKIDVWSLGVTLFALNYGTLPFVDNCNMSEIHAYIDNVIAGRISKVRSPTCGQETELRKHIAFHDLVNSMLCNNPMRRLSMPEVLEHSWTTGKCLRSLQIEDDAANQQPNYNAPTITHSSVDRIMEEHHNLISCVTTANQQTISHSADDTSLKNASSSSPTAFSPLPAEEKMKKKKKNFMTTFF